MSARSGLVGKNHPGPIWDNFRQICPWAGNIYELADLLGTLSVNLGFCCSADLARTSFFPVSVLQWFGQQIQLSYRSCIGFVSVRPSDQFLIKEFPSQHLPKTETHRSKSKCPSLQKPEQDQFVLWILYRSEAPIQKIKSEGHIEASLRAPT